MNNAAGSPPSRSSATAKRLPFYVHPKEWLAGVSIFLCLLYLRTSHFSDGSWFSSFDENQQDLFVYVDSPNGVRHYVGTFCEIDSKMKCRRRDKELIGCQQIYGWAISNEFDIYPCPGIGSEVEDDGTQPESGEEEEIVVEEEESVDCSLEVQLTYQGYPAISSAISFESRSLDGYGVRSEHISSVILSGHYLNEAKIDDLAILMASLLNTRPAAATRDFPFYSQLDREAIVEYYLNEMIALFSPSIPSQFEGGRSEPVSADNASAIETSKATRGGITDTILSRNEILDLALLVANHQSNVDWDDIQLVSRELVENVVRQMIAKPSQEEKQLDSRRQSRHLRLIHASMSAGVEHATSTSTSDSTAICRRPNATSATGPMKYKPVAKHSYQLFFDPWTDQCIYSNFENKTLVTRICERAMQQAPVKLYQLEAPPASDGFLFMSHFCFFAANWFCLIVLASLCTLRQQHVRKMDRGKRQLEQELIDPFLRRSLELKARSLPDEQRQQFFGRLERKIEKWDSNEMSSRFTLRWVLRYRHVMECITALTVLTGLPLSFFHIQSRAKLLESLLMSVAMWTLSYAVPINERKEGSTVATQLRHAFLRVGEILGIVRGSSDVAVSTGCSTRSSDTATGALLNEDLPTEEVVSMQEMVQVRSE